VADNFKETMKIQFDSYLPQWNYVAISKKKYISFECY